MQGTCQHQPLDSSAVLGWTTDMLTERTLLHNFINWQLLGDG